MSTSHPGIVGLLAGGSESFRKENQHLVAGQVLPVDPYQVQGSPYEMAGIKRVGTGKRRIRQSSVGLNKTEQAFFEMMVQQYGKSVRWQPVTLRLANGVRYTPDAVLFVTCGKLFAYEVKGFMRDDAAVKLKVAAHNFPEIAFYLVTKKKGGGWAIEEVLK